MKRLIISSIATACLLVGISVPVSGGWDPDRAKKDRKIAQGIISEFQAKDAGIKRFFDMAHGYAVFPKITKGGMVIGAAHGSGVVYEKGVVVGSAALSQGTVGFQLGFQSYSEIIFFKNKAALDRLKDGKLKFSGQASAVAAEEGASADVDYEEGVAVFTLPRGGLMAEASIGGQHFSFESK
jgi:lipid-binding SYLF domain-containing protein